MYLKNLEEKKNLEERKWQEDGKGKVWSIDNQITLGKSKRYSCVISQQGLHVPKADPVFQRVSVKSGQYSESLTKKN